MVDINSCILDIDGLIKDFKLEDNKVTHSQGNYYKLLPFVANEKNIVTDFTGVVGEFSRLISNKEEVEKFNCESFVDSAVDTIGKFEGNNSKEAFSEIIKSMFIDDGKLVDFNFQTINYINSNYSEKKIAKFIYSLFVDEDLKSDILQYYNNENENILYKLVLKSLPELKDKNTKSDNIKNYIPFIKELFINDFKFLIKNEDFYKKHLKRFLEYYYMFYVSQLAMKLNKFEKVGINNPEKIFYTLSWESTSKNRRAYRYGWGNVKKDVLNLFSHAITLEVLNHNSCDEQLNYLDFYNLLDEENSKTFIEKINEFLVLYKKKTNVEWNNLNINYSSENTAFNKIVELFKTIEFQFIDTSRTRANNAYSNWFISFVQSNFGKQRGPLGYNLNLTEDDIIFFTQLCIGNKGKLRLNELFKEFENRGLNFDRDSSTKIIELYEKLNLLEKKSDSGDAQYVKSIL